MLDIFKDEQALFCEEINNCIKNNKISHAFLIETKNYDKKNDLILSFIKILFKQYTKEEDFLNISTLIDNNTFSDLMIIEADGAFIKKEQVLDIKENFKTTSIENRPRIYWIKEADKLNKYAANSLLKFLEEPEGNVIAIIDTDNRYRVMETIRSRCQIYSLVNNKHGDEEIDETVVDIITTLEKKAVESITYLPMALDNDLRNRDFWISTFKNMISIYENAIRKGKDLDYINYGDVLDLIMSSNDTKKIVNKIDVLFTTLSNMDYNLNISMMLDKFIIEFTGGEFVDDEKIYSYDTNKLTLDKDDSVIVDSDKGILLGQIVVAPYEVDEKDLGKELNIIIRKADKNDMKTDEHNKKEALNALKDARITSEKMKLDMQIIDAIYSFDQSQLLFHFLADTRVDFRELAKKLASKYHTRIELRQIGVRDKAKMVGGLGPCGRILCCNAFLTDFNSVSINMAKNQMLALNPTKINGVCGRLLCCLGYEDEVYTEMKKNMPSIGEIYRNGDIEGKVVSLNLLKKTITIETRTNSLIEVEI